MENRNTLNTVLFFVLSSLILVVGLVVVPWLQHRNQPAPQPDTAPAVVKKHADEKPPENGKAAGTKEEKPAEPTPVPPEPKNPAVKRETIALGNSPRYFITAVLDNRGAAVRDLTLRDFQAADANGRPVWVDGHKKPEELIQARDNTKEGSYLLLDADPNHDETVYSRLGKVNWKVAATHKSDDGTCDGVTFTTEVGGVRISKIYSLQPGDYHLGLKVKLENTTDHDVKFAYHLTSAHGMPIEGKWYTTTTRNAVIGTVDAKGNVTRDLQTLPRITFKDGGEEVPAQGGAIQYAGTTVQYFSSLVVVSEKDLPEKYLARARPVVETSVMPFARVTEVRDRALYVRDRNGKEFPHPIQLPADVELTPANHRPVPGDRVTLTYRIDDMGRLVARHIYTGDESEQLLFDDITVHLVSVPFDLKPHTPLEQHYLLYNGPVKVKLLGFQEGDQAVAPALVHRYETTLHLDTVTDFHSPGWFGDFCGSTGITSLILLFENFMHNVLYILHVCTRWLPWQLGYGLSILLLTVLVRALMFPLSRKQALTSIRMQALAPEIKKLQEKYKDDRQALGMAQMELYRKHGVSPIGSCWTIFLQMPIFIGLYYALQESIRFRLAPFLWMQNLAAPDMLIHWGSGIPYISLPSSYGSMLYLGPYFNLLPVIVAGMMLVQQQMMTPPPADEQQEAQQKMMKFMTVVFALMFYKLAAGLCLYFITSSLWSFAERKLLPKKKPGSPAEVPQARSNGLFMKAFDRLQSLSQPRSDTAGAITPAPPTAVSNNLQAGGETGKRSRKNRRKDRERRRNETAGGNGADGAGADGGPGWWTDTRRRVNAWWQQVLREARKK